MSQANLSVPTGSPATPYSSGGTIPTRDGAPPTVSWKQYVTDFMNASGRAKAALIGSLILVAIGPAGLSALTPFVVPAFAMKTGTPPPEAILLFVTLPLIIGPLILPFVGVWVDRLGAQRAAFPALLLYAMTTAIIPLSVDSPWLLGTLLILASIFGFGASLGIAFKVISGWFPEHRGIGFGLVGVASSLFSAVFSPLFQWLVNGNVPASLPRMPGMNGGMPANAPPVGVVPTVDPGVFAGLGWDGTYYVIAGAIAVIGIPAVLWLVSEPKVTAAVVMPRTVDVHMPGVPFRKAISTRAWIFITLFLALAAAGPIAMRLNAVDFYGQVGLDPATVSLALSVLFGTSVVGLLAAGAVLDRASRPWVVAVLLAAVPIGLALALFNNGSALLLYVSMALLGFATGAESTLGPTLIARYFGLKSFAALQGLTLAITSPALAVSPYLVSAVKTGSGSYTVPLLVLIGIGVIAVILAAMLPKYPRPWKLQPPLEETVPARMTATS
ncbi:MFS transporter [Pseudomonas brassicacearum subsp. neoaurantiaca]|uniref:Putative Permease of the major facilitator superfamily Putative Membrane protein n=1 Tax=Pseudomonas brassicacearum (strain NFM421) TaxID=994484 RepID=F2K8H6_PSEBN|nr:MULTISPECIES: MFS transporter [Pseudomonas]AEA67132.1 Putative Permease of the major facilitator superfamily; Putative Membrane protein [Pseudomonas brassicacearum subsp. brassicacearum NFM421]AOS39326.1 MFS transporter permease [Pseudomonas brassicacearum]KIR16474.1 Major Facilitator Superfamily protein [Pseudomonas fluorescens]BBP51448.1 MFS transporter [Pseudomonas sp. St386]